MIGLGLLMALSLHYTSDPTYGRDKTILFFLLVLPIIVIAPSVISSAKSLRSAMFILFWTLVIYVFTSIVLHQQAESVGGRFSTLSDLIITAQYCGLIVVVGFLFLVFGKVGAIGKYFLVCMVSLGTLLLFMTGTRGAVLALVLAMLFVYWFVHVDGFKGLLRRSRQTYVIVLVGSGIMFSGSLVLKNTLPEEIYSRFTSVETFFSNFTYSEVRNWETSSTRMLRYMSATNAFFDHPLTGVGVGGYRTVLLEGGYRDLKHRAQLLDESAHVYPHNMVLEFACEQGILGLIVILWVIYLNFKMICTLRSIYHSDPQRNFVICLCATVYFFGLCVSMTSLDIPRMMILWWGIGLLLAADRIYCRQSRFLSEGRGPRHGTLYPASEV